MGSVQPVERRNLWLLERGRRVSHKWSLLYVLVTAFTFEAYRQFPAFNLPPLLAFATRILSVYGPELFSFGLRKRRKAFRSGKVPSPIECKSPQTVGTII